MKNLVRFSLALAFLLLVLTAHLRQSASGVGCSDWPDCYARLVPATTAAASTAMAWASGAREWLTGLFGLAALFLTLVAVRDGRHRLLSACVLGLAIVQAWLQMRQGAAQHPAAYLAAIMAGFLLIGLLAWLQFRLSPGSARYTETRIRHVRPLLLAALVLLALQIFLGGLTSVNYAATACTGFPSCNGAWFPDATIYSALRVDRPYAMSPDGYALGGFERQAVHLAHRWFAFLSALAIISVAIASYFSTEAMRRLGVAAVTLLTGAVIGGGAAALGNLPVWLAVLHPALAAALLLVLLKMHALSRERWWLDYSMLPDSPPRNEPAWR
jgi:cytochrome c oxidase assembly protein subunit 15